MARNHDEGLPRRGAALVFDEQWRGYWVAAGRTWTAPVAADGLLLVDERREAHHTPTGLAEPDVPEGERDFFPAGREPIVVARELGGAYWLFGVAPAFAERDDDGRLNFEESGFTEDAYLDDETLPIKRRACAVLEQAARRTRRTPLTARVGRWLGAVGRSWQRTRDRNHDRAAAATPEPRRRLLDPVLHYAPNASQEYEKLRVNWQFHANQHVRVGEQVFDVRVPRRDQRYPEVLAVLTFAQRGGHYSPERADQVAGVIVALDGEQKFLPAHMFCRVNDGDPGLVGEPK